MARANFAAIRQSPREATHEGQQGFIGARLSIAVSASRKFQPFRPVFLWKDNSGRLVVDLRCRCLSSAKTAHRVLLKKFACVCHLTRSRLGVVKHTKAGSPTPAVPLDVGSLNRMPGEGAPQGGPLSPLLARPWPPCLRAWPCGPQADRVAGRRR